MTFNYEEIATLDYFDSRDVVERKAEIEREIVQGLGTLTTDEIARLRVERLVLHTLLEELAEEFPPSKWMDVRTDTDCGVCGFAWHYAEEYAREYAWDVVDMDRSEPWPFNHVDWEAAADDLKEDYTEVEILGSTFYLRD